MPIKTTPTYTEHEVSRILRESEEASISDQDRGEGHAEGLHELLARGKNRASTDLDEMEQRIIGPERKRRTGAFVGTQAAAIAFALNKKAGQTALGWLSYEKCEFIFAQIDIAAGNFAMIGYDGDVTTPAPGGARFVVAPGGVALTGFLVPIEARAGGIAMKLMKTSGKDLHIRTAFPLIAAPNPQRANIRWRDGHNQDQDLPI
ncbi:hypothetical protein [Plastoroseomonas arctica]|uniref:Uncharacterized protein n=1 Tax=Plastoroseomonas arctica TaxID=1509237 RepID=A0AAF1JZW4_9PROT|nr:hypothetical protein [Plastoroseomonas arctica]MBR0656198.1 hypothetical protein [Plastoroseomonas arctica]